MNIRVSTHTSYMFIDGASLDGALKAATDRYSTKSPFALDYAAFAAEQTKVFYYDAIPSFEDQDRTPAQTALAEQKIQKLESIRKLDKYHVFEGDTRRRRSKGGQEQKMVDVAIAVDMLTHTFRRNMDSAILVTGDQDFKPLLDALVREGMFVTLWYPIGATNQILIDAADAKLPLTTDLLYNCSTFEFRNKTPFPSHYRDYSRPVGKQIAHWDNADHGHVSLWIDGQLYWLHADPVRDKPIRIESESLDMLKLYAQDVFGIDVPELPGQP
ncbi:MAG: NYN domain-containing protein [Hyphomonadaceae bacterium]|nr:NYN domain-containing protein [Hyphomonadaceae bacterium]